MTLADLIRSERVLPGSLANVPPPSPGVVTSLGAWAGDLGLSGRIHADGPYGATIIPDTSDLWEYKTLDEIRDRLARRMPGFTVVVRADRVVVRARLR